MAPCLRQDEDPPPVYGAASNEFTIEVHHGGVFSGQGVNRAYVDGNVTWFDYMEADNWCYSLVEDMVAILEYGFRPPNLEVYWLLPGKDLSDGLRIISSDKDAHVMRSVADKAKNLVLYFDHHTQSGATKEHEAESESDDSFDDLEFRDTDNELEEEDDDLLLDNVDERTSQKVANDKKAAGSRKGSEIVICTSKIGDDSTDDEELMLPSDSDQGDVTFNFKSFTHDDMNNPIFMVGMVFASVEMVRKALTEYSLRHRVDIKIPRNDRTRICAHCAPGCPWRMYASWDSRVHRSSSVTEWNANMEIMKTLNSDAHSWLEQMPPNTCVRAFFSTFPKCDVLLNNSCEVFNKYILEARELPILSMLQRIKGQLTTRIYNKQKELVENWQGPVCPKIRKKLLKISESANLCYVLPAGKGIFQVQERDFQYIVDIEKKKCDCRRWDLTGIPCNHAISCLRHERIPAEDLLPVCYSTQTYSNVYGFNINPCRDKTMWKKTNGPQVLPPVYEKKVGRPPKSRKKQPHEVEGKTGSKMSKHGVTMTCSWCKEPNHNRAGCMLRKPGQKPKHVTRRNPMQSQCQQDQYGEPVITQEMSQPRSGVADLTKTMLSQMMQESASTSGHSHHHGPLPDCLHCS